MDSRKRGEVLAGLGGQQLTDAIDGLTAAVVGQTTSVETRAELAGVLAGMGHERRALARTTL